MIQALRPYRRQQRNFCGRHPFPGMAGFQVMGGVTVLAAFLLNRKSMGTAKSFPSSGNVVNKQDSGSQGNSRQLWRWQPLFPAFLADIVCMLALDLNGDVTVLYPVQPSCLCVSAPYSVLGKQSPEKVTLSDRRLSVCYPYFCPRDRYRGFLLSRRRRHHLDSRGRFWRRDFE